MNALVIVLRLVHILCGVLWVGFGVFMAVVLGPALERMGPDGGKVMSAIGPKLHTVLMPLVAILTILSGVWLYWIVSGGFSGAYAHSRMGMTFAIGGVAAITTFVLGLTVIRPAMTRAMILGASIGSAPPERQAAIAAEAKQFRDRAIGAGKLGTSLLVVATLCMAVARYL
jgi:hypothetical protein